MRTVIIGLSDWALLLMLGILFVVYVCSVISILFVGTVFCDAVSKEFYFGLVMLAVLWPYVLYRGV